MKRIIQSVVMASALCLGVLGVVLAQDNPFVGTWKLNLAKSKYTGMQPPKSETRAVVAQGQGQKTSFEGVAADGSRISYSQTSNLDGKEVPISGTGQAAGADAIVSKRLDANTLTNVLKRNGKTVQTTRTQVSKDGKVTTQIARGTDAQGRPFSYTQVWDKQ
jgi:hypothetical protein